MAYGGDTRPYLGWIDDSQITTHDESTAVRIEGTAAKPFQLMVEVNQITEEGLKYIEDSRSPFILRSG